MSLDMSLYLCYVWIHIKSSHMNDQHQIQSKHQGYFLLTEKFNNLYINWMFYSDMSKNKCRKVLKDKTWTSSTPNNAKYSNSSYKIMPGLFWDDTEQTTNRSWDQKFHWVKGQPGLMTGGFVKLTSLKINGNKIVTT